MMAQEAIMQVAKHKKNMVKEKMQKADEMRIKRLTQRGQAASPSRNVEFDGKDYNIGQFDEVLVQQLSGSYSNSEADQHDQSPSVPDFKDEPDVGAKNIITLVDQQAEDHIVVIRNSNNFDDRSQTPLSKIVPKQFEESIDNDSHNSKPIRLFPQKKQLQKGQTQELPSSHTHKHTDSLQEIKDNESQLKTIIKQHEEGNQHQHDENEHGCSRGNEYWHDHSANDHHHHSHSKHSHQGSSGSIGPKSGKEGVKESLAKLLSMKRTKTIERSAPSIQIVSKDGSNTSKLSKGNSTSRSLTPSKKTLDRSAKTQKSKEKSLKKIEKSLDGLSQQELSKKLSESKGDILLKENIIMKMMRNQLEEQGEKNQEENKNKEISAYWAKMNRLKRAKQQKKKDKINKSIGPKNRTSVLLKQPKQKKDQGSNKNESESEGSDTEKEIVERKRKLEMLYTIGNASRVGSRPGESLIPMNVGEEDEDGFKLSIFRRDLIQRQDVHMKIISEHRKQLVHEGMRERLKNAMAESFIKKIPTWKLWMNRIFCCTCRWDPVIPLLNKYLIEEYIDNFFFIQIPESASIQENYEKTYQLVHELYITEHELANYEAEEKAKLEQQKILTKSEHKNQPSMTFDDEELRRILRDTRNPDLYADKRQTALNSADDRYDIEKGSSLLEDENKNLEGGENEYISVPEYQQPVTRQSKTQQGIRSRQMSGRDDSDIPDINQYKFNSPTSSKSGVSFKRPGMTYAKSYYKTGKDKKKSPNKHTPEYILEDRQEIFKLKDRDPLIETEEKAMNYELPLPLRVQSPRYSFLKPNEDSHLTTVNRMPAEKWHEKSTMQNTTSQDLIAFEAVDKLPQKLQVVRTSGMTQEPELMAETINSVGNDRTIIERPMSQSGDQYGTINSGRPEEVLEKYGVPDNFIKRDMSVQLQVSENLLAHTEMINAILIDIKPYITQMCCTPFTAEMVKKYFRKVREEQLELMDQPVDDPKLMKKEWDKRQKVANDLAYDVKAAQNIERLDIIKHEISPINQKKKIEIQIEEEDSKSSKNGKDSVIQHKYDTFGVNQIDLEANGPKEQIKIEESKEQINEPDQSFVPNEYEGILQEDTYRVNDQTPDNLHKALQMSDEYKINRNDDSYRNNMRTPDESQSPTISELEESVEKREPSPDGITHQDQMPDSQINELTAHINTQSDTASIGHIQVRAQDEPPEERVFNTDISFQEIGIQNTNDKYQDLITLQSKETEIEQQIQKIAAVKSRQSETQAAVTFKPQQEGMVIISGDDDLVDKDDLDVMEKEIMAESRPFTQERRTEITDPSKKKQSSIKNNQAIRDAYSSAAQSRFIKHISNQITDQGQLDVAFNNIMDGFKSSNSGSRQVGGSQSFYNSGGFRRSHAENPNQYMPVLQQAYNKKSRRNSTSSQKMHNDSVSVEKRSVSFDSKLGKRNSLATNSPPRAEIQASPYFKKITKTGREKIINLNEMTSLTTKSFAANASNSQNKSNFQFQGSQIIDSKYGPIHLRGNNQALGSLNSEERIQQQLYDSKRQKMKTANEPVQSRRQSKLKVQFQKQMPDIGLFGRDSVYSAEETVSNFTKKGFKNVNHAIKPILSDFRNNNKINHLTDAVFDDIESNNSDRRENTHDVPSYTQVAFEAAQADRIISIQPNQKNAGRGRRGQQPSGKQMRLKKNFQ